MHNADEASSSLSHLGIRSLSLACALTRPQCSCHESPHVNMNQYVSVVSITKLAAFRMFAVRGDKVSIVNVR